MPIRQKTLTEVLKLPAEERMDLVRQLLLSFDDASPDEDPDEVRAAWRDEIHRRLAEIDRGEVELLDWQESVSRIRQALDEVKQR